MTYDLEALYAVPRSLLADEARCVKDLTVHNRAIAANNKYGPNKWKAEADKPDPDHLEARIDGDLMYFPRAYRPLLKDGSYPVVNQKIPAGFKGYRMTSNLVYRPSQVAVEQHMFEPDGRLKEGGLELAVGKGKTPLSLHFAALQSQRVPTRVLVVVPTSTLQDQWVNEANKYLEIEGGVGRIGNGVFDVEGRGLVVGMIQSLSMDGRDASLYSAFNLLIIDEGHSAAAPKYSEVLRRFWGRRLFLTATFKRGDGLHKTLALHSGPILYTDLTPDMPVEVFMADAGLTYERDYEDPYQWAKMLSLITASEERNQYILGQLKKVLSIPGRTVLVLGDRLDGLNWLYDRVDLPEGEKCLVVGSVDKADRPEMIRSARVTFASSKLARVGLDHSAFDTLLMLSPIEDEGQVRQAFGRIQRIHAGKSSPRVAIFVDTATTLGKRKALSMVKKIKALGFKASPVGKWGCEFPQ